MMRNRKKLLSWVLVLLMTISLFPSPALVSWPLQVQAEEENDEEQSAPDDEISDLLKTAEDNSLLDDGQIEILVQLEDPAGTLSDDRASWPGRRKCLRAVQDDFLSSLDEHQIKYEIVYRLDLLLNVIGLRMAPEDVKKLGETTFSQVQAITNNTSYTLPTKTIQPYMNDSVGMIGADAAWAQGFTGKGAIISVIDTGIQWQHPDFYLDSEDMVPACLAADKVNNLIESDEVSAGKFFTNKIPFGFNYYNEVFGGDLHDIYIPGLDHGTHVAGTIGANGDPEKGGIRGVAPDSQLLAMQVFNMMGQTSEAIYLKAIEDSIKLGANAINMSLGAPAGHATSQQSPMNKAIAAAESIGCLVVIANGNEGTPVYPGNPRAEDPDASMAGTPAVEPDSLAVGSINNVFETLRPIELVGEEIDAEHRFLSTIITDGSDFTKVYDQVLEVVDCGDANSLAEVPDVVKGKVALVQRGGKSFTEKLQNVEQKGAVMAIVYDNVNNGQRFGMRVEGVEIPSFAITQDDGLYILASRAKIKVHGDYDHYDYPGAGDMSDFSSWGLSPTGDLKPEITAPGGRIFSTVGEGYDSYDGTSMATPHVAAAVGLMSMRFREDAGPGYRIEMDCSGPERHRIIKNLLMSTAKPLAVTDAKGLPSYASPRQEGAGVLNLERGIRAYVTALATDGIGKNYSKVLLGDLAYEEVSFKVKLVNYGRQDVTFNGFTVAVSTDNVVDGHMTCTPDNLLTKEVPGSITVPGAQGNQPGEVLVDVAFREDELSSSHATLSAKMPNGYYLEGFVFFNTADDTVHPTISLPFVGFRNVNGKAFDDLPDMEKAIYEYDDLQVKAPSFYDERLGAENVNFTHFYSALGEEMIILGETTRPGDEHRSFLLDEEHPMVVSPNGDGKLDILGLNLVFVRTARSYRTRLLDAAGNEIDKVWQTKDDGWIPRNSTTTGLSYDEGYWDLKIGEDTLSDGLYYLTLEAKGARSRKDDNFREVGRYPFIVDTVAPSIDWETSSYNPKTGELKLSITDGDGSGVAKAYAKVNGETYVIDPETGHSQLPANSNPEDVGITIIDKAYNEVALPLSEALANPETLEKATIKVSGQDSIGTDVELDYRLYRKVGEDYIEVDISDDNQYVLGDYRVVLINWDTGYLLSSEGAQEVSLETSGEIKEVSFEFKLETRKLGGVVVYSSDNDGYPGGRYFSLVNKEDGVTYNLYQNAYNPEYFLNYEIPYGDYLVVAENVLDGWRQVPATLEITVDSPGPEEDEDLVRLQFAAIDERASIEVVSTLKDSKTTPDAFEDITYTITRDETRETYTDKDSVDLPYGTYTIVVDKIPEGYLLEEKSQKVTLTSNEPKSIEFVYEELSEDKQGRLSVELFNSDGTESDLVIGEDVIFEVSDEAGYTYTDWEKMPLGLYQIEAVTLPRGYMISEIPKVFEITAEEKDVTLKLTICRRKDVYKNKSTWLMVEIDAPEGYDVRKLKLKTIDSDGNERIRGDYNYNQEVGLVFIGFQPIDEYYMSLVSEDDIVTSPETIDIALTDKPMHTIEFKVMLKETVKTVTFDYHYEEKTDQVQVANGDIVNKPITPQRPGYFFAGWFTDDSYENEYDFAQPVTEDLTLYAKWVKLIQTVEAPDAPPVDDYVRVTFKSAEGGSLTGIDPAGKAYEGKTEVVYDVYKDAIYMHLAPYIPTPVSPAGFQFIGWQPALGALSEKVKTATYEAQYRQPRIIVADDPDNPGELLKGYARLTFDATSQGKIGDFQKQIIDVLAEGEGAVRWSDAELQAEIPQTVTSLNPDKNFVGWAPEIPASDELVTSRNFEAQYSNKPVVILPEDQANPGEPAEGYIRLSFYATHAGSFADDLLYYYLDVKAGTSWENEELRQSLPTEVSSKLPTDEFVGWDPELPTEGTVECQQTFRATFRPVAGVAAVVPVVPEAEVAEGCVRVSFVAGEHGSLTGLAAASEAVSPGHDVLSYDVNTAFNFEALASYIPEAVAQEGYEFVGWDPELPAAESQITEEMTFTAIFRLSDQLVLPGDLAQPVAADSVRITFQAGEGGTLSCKLPGGEVLSGQTSLTLDVKKSATVADLAPYVPSVEAVAGFKFTGWDSDFPQDVISVVNLPREFTATYGPAKGDAQALIEAYDPATEPAISGITPAFLPAGVKLVDIIATSAPGQFILKVHATGYADAGIVDWPIIVPQVNPDYKLGINAVAFDKKGDRNLGSNIDVVEEMLCSAVNITPLGDQDYTGTFDKEEIGELAGRIYALSEGDQASGAAIGYTVTSDKETASSVAEEVMAAVGNQPLVGHKLVGSADLSDEELKEMAEALASAAFSARPDVSLQLEVLNPYISSHIERDQAVAKVSYIFNDASQLAVTIPLALDGPPNSVSTESSASPAEDPVLVTFDYQCDELYPDDYLHPAGEILEPPIPVRAGYVFVGWYSDPDLSTAFDFANPISSNLTLYAKWEPAKVGDEGDELPVEQEPESNQKPEPPVDTESPVKPDKPTEPEPKPELPVDPEQSVAPPTETDQPTKPIDDKDPKDAAGLNHADREALDLEMYFTAQEESEEEVVYLLELDLSEMPAEDVQVLYSTTSGTEAVTYAVPYIYLPPVREVEPEPTEPTEPGEPIAPGKPEITPPAVDDNSCNHGLDDLLDDLHKPVKPVQANVPKAEAKGSDDRSIAGSIRQPQAPSREKVTSLPATGESASAGVYGCLALFLAAALIVLRKHMR